MPRADEPPADPGRLPDPVWLDGLRQSAAPVRWLWDGYLGTRVSYGHALIADALYRGLAPTVRAYLAAVGAR